MATYRVVRTEEYYGPKTVKRVALSNDTGEPLWGLTRREAVNAAQVLNSPLNPVCGHNMASPPQYTVSQEKSK